MDCHQLYGVEVGSLFYEVAVFVIGGFRVAGKPLQMADEVFEGAPVVVQVVDGVVAYLAEFRHSLQLGDIHQAMLDLRVLVNALEHFGVAVL